MPGSLQRFAVKGRQNKFCKINKICSLSTFLNFELCKLLFYNFKFEKLYRTVCLNFLVCKISKPCKKWEKFTNSTNPFEWSVIQWAAIKIHQLPIVSFPTHFHNSWKLSHFYFVLLSMFSHQSKAVIFYFDMKKVLMPKFEKFLGNRQNEFQEFKFNVCLHTINFKT